MAEKITYGVRNGHYAQVTHNADGIPSFGIVKAWTGWSEMSLPPVGDPLKVYADDVTYYKVHVNQGYDGTVSAYQVPEDFKVNHMGEYKDSNGVMVERSSAQPMDFALLGEFQTADEVGADKKRFVLYNCSAGRADFTGSTKTESVEPASFSIPVTVSPTLVSMANSGAVADRVLSYYSSARPLSSSIVAGDERPGDAVTLEDAFDDVSNGLMESMSIQISSTLKSDSTIIVGYIPENKGNDYNNRIVLTGGGVWEVPEGVESAKCVLIGSGSGGSRGLSGSSGGNVTLSFPGGTGSRSSGPGLGGSGGEAGLPGLGGKIHEVDIALSPGAQITYHTYSGGAAGVNPGDAGADGQDSVFGAYSSASGNRSDAGYIDRMSGDILGAKGQEGVNGGNGGDGGTAGVGEDGGDVLSWVGGSGNAGWSGPSTVPVGTASIGGGAGSGAAYGSNGLNATGSGTVQSIAAGANGVNASPLPENSLSSYGKGGAGSNGGSGGGGAGRLQITVTQSSLSFTWTALGGTPGLPSIARNGSQGCIVLYY